MLRDRSVKNFKLCWTKVIGRFACNLQGISKTPNLTYIIFFLKTVIQGQVKVIPHITLSRATSLNASNYDKNGARSSAMALYCHCGPLVMISKSFLCCDLYFSMGGVTRGQVRLNPVCANNLDQNQDRTSQMVSLCSSEVAVLNDMQRAAVRLSHDLHVTSCHWSWPFRPT